MLSEMAEPIRIFAFHFFFGNEIIRNIQFSYINISPISPGVSIITKRSSGMTCYGGGQCTRKMQYSLLRKKGSCTIKDVKKQMFFLYLFLGLSTFMTFKKIAI